MSLVCSGLRVRLIQGLFGKGPWTWSDIARNRRPEEGDTYQENSVRLEEHVLLIFLNVLLDGGVTFMEVLNDAFLVFSLTSDREYLTVGVEDDANVLQRLMSVWAVREIQGVVLT